MLYAEGTNYTELHGRIWNVYEETQHVFQPKHGTIELLVMKITTALLRGATIDDCWLEKNIDPECSSIRSKDKLRIIQVDEHNKISATMTQQ